MADILDVQNVLATLAQTAVYPNGTSHPSISNCPVRIFPGWPIPDTLDADLTAGNVQISIFPTNIARVSTRFGTEWFTTNVSTATLVATANATLGTVTITGTISTPQSVMVIANGLAYSYGVLPTDTVNSIATQLALLIPNASSINNVITITGIHSLTTSIIVSGTSTRELAREKRMIMVTVWAPTPLIRSQIGYAITVLFAANYRISLPDGFDGQLIYSGSREVDDLEKVKCYRRDIHFIVEFATTQPEIDYVIGTNKVVVTPYNCTTVLPSP